MPFGYGEGFGLMWLFPLLFLAIFIYFMRGMFGGGMHSGGSQTPREILDRRFASGEISKEEYEEMKATLSR